MTIDFLVNEVASGWRPTDKFLSGTEDSVVQWANRLAKDNQVTVFHNSPDGIYEDYKGVRYEDRNRYIGGADVCINVKSSNVSLGGSRATLYLTNETNATKLDLSGFSGVIWPSHWAADNIPVNNNKVFILPHGYDPELIYPGKKVAKQCFYASSPDRGLDTLLEAWPTVMAAHPDATLLLTYGVIGVSLPGVICLGELEDEDMSEVYNTSQFWLHPASGGELFCMTGIKAQVAKCWPIYFPIMALSETVKFGTKSAPETFAQDIIGAMNNPPEVPDGHYDDWDESTAQLWNIIESVI